LPWYVRGLNRVGYWHRPSDRPLAPVLVTSIDVANELNDRLDGYVPSHFGLRSGKLIMVYVRKDLWKEYLERRRISRMNKLAKRRASSANR